MRASDAEKIQESAYKPTPPGVGICLPLLMAVGSESSFQGSHRCDTPRGLLAPAAGRAAQTFMASLRGPNRIDSDGLIFGIGAYLVGYL